ncbi:Protein of unknown function [Pyronema omphalodes CBS 100304]|uniref:Uncharacterized protein n=1 Tax=Pyronema omphalodes (strain CBS 100304) TaxID=1076935 RepID=U4KTQ6_PYROM|nr:Protein of unknown function [Pyronema omphalodes CBS 100304]
MADVDCLLDNPTNPAPEVYILPGEEEENLDIECTLGMESRDISSVTSTTATRTTSPDFDTDIVIVDEQSVIELDSLLTDPVQVPAPTPAPAPASGPQASAHAPFVAITNFPDLTPASAPVLATDPAELVELIESNEPMKPVEPIQPSQPMEPAFPATFPEVQAAPTSSAPSATTSSTPPPRRTFTLTPIESAIHLSTNGPKIASLSRIARLVGPESSWNSCILLISGSAVQKPLMVFYTLVSEWDDFLRYLKIHGGLEGDEEVVEGKGEGEKKVKRYRMVIKCPSYALGSLASSPPSSPVSASSSQSFQADTEFGATTTAAAPTTLVKRRIIANTSPDYPKSATAMKKLIEVGKVHVWDQISFDCAMQLVNLLNKTKEFMVEIEEVSNKKVEVAGSVTGDQKGKRKSSKETTEVEKNKTTEKNVKLKKVKEATN